MIHTSETKINKVENSRLEEVDFDNLPFGKVFSDHMLVMSYEDGQWDQGEILAYDYLKMSPASLVLHYGQAIFEGMKAEQGPDGSILMFRPMLNIKRFNKSAVRMAMPEVPEDLFLDKLTELLDIDRKWVPTHEGASLYIRPFMYASDEFIGVQASKKYKFIIFTCPVGPYYVNPVNVYIENHYTRAVQGGTGFAKAAGNYAATLYPAKLAKEKGYDQILWTDAHEHKYVQEIGTMNVFFIVDGKVLTPALNDCILEGTTRQTIIEIFKSEGYTVEERAISKHEIFEYHEKGILQDCFGAGTAAVIIPISKMSDGEKEIILPDVSTREHSAKVKEHMISIKRGLKEDVNNWIIKV